MPAFALTLGRGPATTIAIISSPASWPIIWLACGEIELNTGWYWQALSVATALACGLLIGSSAASTCGVKARHSRCRSSHVHLAGAGVGTCRAYRSERPGARRGALIAGAAAILAVDMPDRPDLAKRPEATSPIAAFVTLDSASSPGSDSRASPSPGQRSSLCCLRSKRASRFARAARRGGRQGARPLRRHRRSSPSVSSQRTVTARSAPGIRSGLWLVVVLVTGFSFLGYVANRIFGERHRTIATAPDRWRLQLDCSHSALAQRLGHEQKEAPNRGIAFATAVMYLRVPILIAIFATRFCRDLRLAPARRNRRLGGRLLALPKGAEERRTEPPATPSRSAGARLCRLRRGRCSRRGLGAGTLRRRAALRVLLLIVGSMSVDTAIITLGGSRRTRSRLARRDRDRRNDHRQHGGEDRDRLVYARRKGALRSNRNDRERRGASPS